MKNSGAGLIAYWIEKGINEVEERFEEIIRNVLQGDKREKISIKHRRRTEKV